MKEMRRVLALILCFVMLVGYVPTSAFAAEAETTAPSETVVEARVTEAAIEVETTEAAQIETTIPEEPAPETTVAATEPQATIPETTAAAETEATVPVTEPEETVPETTAAEEVGQADDGVLQVLVGSGETAGVLPQVAAAYADIDALMLLSGEDAAAEDAYLYDEVSVVLGVDQYGEYDTEDYGVYVIDEAACKNMETAAIELELYLSDKVLEGYSKPIFVLSHLPLHYGAENAGELFAALNAAGGHGLTIVYLYSQSEADYLGGEVYLASGQKICIAESETYLEQTLCFTYLSAGEGDMVVLSLEDEAVTVSRYDENGVAMLKTEGVGNDQMDADTVTCESPAEIKASETKSLTWGTMAAEAVTAGTGDTIYVLAGGDYQEGNADGSTLHVNSSENVANILDQIVAAGYTSMDGMLFIGDYDGTDHNNTTNVTNGINSLMATVQEEYSNINHDNSVLVQGNHDPFITGIIDATGGHDFDGYSAYVLNEDDYVNGGGSVSGVTTLANNLATWLTGKLSEQYDAPIFVVSHLPLAYSPRTVVQGDAKYAKLIVDVLNDAGEKGLNIIFLHGHDHAYGCDNYLGGEAIYRAKGDTIYVADVDDVNKYTTETLNFTYMNAGYTGYYNESGYNINETDDSKLTMTVFAITDNQVTVERYSADGKYNLSSAGRDGYYSNTSVTASSLGLAYNEAVYGSPQTIQLAEVSEEEDLGTNGVYVPVTPESTDDVTTAKNGWVTLIDPVVGTTTYTYTLATSITAGGEYVIVGNSNDVALMDNNGSMGSQSVTISGTAMTSTTALTEWTFSGSDSGTIYNGTHYLRYSTGMWNSGFNLNESSSTLTFADNGSNFRIYNNASYGTDYSFYYDGSSWTRSSSTQYVRLYQLTDTTTTVDTNGTYGKIDGDLSYTVAAGADAAAALAAVMEGIDGYYYEAMSPPGGGVTGTKVDDSVLTWTLDPNYDGNKPGDYSVTISYNGIELGTAEVIVPNTTTYYIAEGDGLYTVEMNTSAEDALAAVKTGITVSSATDAEGTNKTEISDNDVTWEWVDTYDPKNYGPYTVKILYNGTSLGTVEVKVEVDYSDLEGLEGWTHVGETEATGGTHTYTLDTNGIDSGSGNKYLIVARNAAYLLNAGNAVAVTISSDGKTATTTTRDYEYYFTGSTGGLITRDGTNTLYQQNWGIHVGNVSDSNLDAFTNLGNGYYRFYDNDGTDRSLYYDGDSWTVTSSNHTDSSYSVRLYKYTGTTGGTPGGPIYAIIEGPSVYTVTQGKSSTSAMSAVKAGITGYISSNADGSDSTELSDNQLTWTWLNKYNGNAEGDYWVQISYNGVVLGTVKVHVEPGVVNNYPEYPDEGAVKVSKTATGVDFQSSGIAQVELSASGIPTKKGVDVIVMLDTSSSMNTYKVTGGTKTRLTVLEESMEKLVAQFKTPGEDGHLLDIRVAVADFNGFNGYGGVSGTPYDRDENDRLADQISYTANGNQAQIYTGDYSLGAGAFIDAADLKENWVGSLTYDSGTNYDYAMDAIYQLGTAIKAANTEDRDLYVIFMSDGAAMQWNYYHSNGRSTDWQYWLTGAWSVNEISAQLDCTEHYYYYAADVDGDGYVNEHRMADAIKGNPTEEYEVIRKANTLGTPVSGYENLYNVPGLGAKMFAIAFDPTTDQNTPPEAMTESIKTIASDQTGTTQYYYEVTSAEALASAFNVIGTEIAYAASNARFVDQVGDDFNLQLKTSKYKVVENGVQVEKSLAPVIEILTYDIYTRQDYLNGTITEDKIGDRKGTSTLNELVVFNADGTKAYSSLIDVDGDGTMGVSNIVKNADGTYSYDLDTVGTDKFPDADNIFGADGIIYAKTFLYNTTALDVTIDGVNIPTGTKADGTTTGSSTVVPSETFYWKMGTVTTTELAMRYYVYLEGSMEGTKEAGSYPTNEFAILYYDNYLGNPAKKETVSPVMAWKSANVSYAFYLVDEQGNIIVNQTTGQTGSFANKIAVTNPVVYEEIMLNNTDQVQSIDVAAISEDVLPKYYTLYDDAAVYTVTINSNSTGAWEITKGKNDAGEDLVASTYVMQYDSENSSAYSNALVDGKNEDGDIVVTGHDYTHTVVWFAVVWSVQAHPDTVVVDYGLPVDISVLTNDMFGEKGKLAGVGAYTDGIENTTAGTSMASGFGNSYTGKYGAAKADTTTGKVRYALNTMQMNGYEKFAYAVNYTGTDNAGYYYDTVTVIPATTIYYEESFLTFKSYTRADANSEYVEGTWGYEGTANSNAVQQEDRPGKYSLTDANNIYGYDEVNLGMSMYSLGQARKINVNANTYATAEFTFTGTGFDVISMTSSDTGVLTVQVYDANNTLKTSKIVDTYYGVEYVDGEWVIAETDEALYQVPVLEVADLDYGTYRVLIRATHYSAYNNLKDGEYDLYLDAIRIYDPANDGAADGTTDTTIEDAYKADGEGWPSYIELRNGLIDAKTLGNVDTDTEVTGLVFIDGDEEVGDAQLEDYISYGPNNEVYLAPGQRVAFMLGTSDNVANIHIGVKSANGETATYTITNIAKSSNTNTGVEAGDYYGAKTSTVNTTTDMYYDLTGWKNDIIVISNTGDRYNTTGIISLTNIKSTYTSDPNATDDNATEELYASEASVSDMDTVTRTISPMGAKARSLEPENFETYVYMTPEAAEITLRSLNAPAVEDEVPETTEPETTVPEETEPEETEPEVTEPETEPEETVPEETEPEEDKPEDSRNPVEDAIKDLIDKIKKTLKKMINDWFR